jgi:aminocarboxymuconate-semialdehyde decarboxylase
MAIDVHAHYVSPSIIDQLLIEGPSMGIDVVESQPQCHCLHFHYGLKCRPFFSRLLESPQARMDAMQAQGVHKQVLSGWVDVFGHGLADAHGKKWHEMLNNAMGDFCAQNPSAFSFLASGHMPNAGLAARELERAVKEQGALGGVVACNVEGVNLGELDLEDYWACASELGVPIFLHPTQAQPTPRSKAFALNQVVQYTFDTTLSVGSLIWSGVLDRHPHLKIILSHGGGALPYLIGRFDFMHAKGHHEQNGIKVKKSPWSYLSEMYFDTILHDKEALHYLKQKVGVSQIVLGTDDSFPPADPNPLQSLKDANFNAAEIHTVSEINPRALFKI